MYLSYLMINTGTHPDRPRPGRLWMRNIYTVHQRLSMAFPDNSKKEKSLFLFRIDEKLGSTGYSPVVIVQSEYLPDWDHAFNNANILLAALPEVHKYNPQFTVGDNLRYHIRINPVKRSKDSGKRLAIKGSESLELPEEYLVKWFQNKITRSNVGFTLQQCTLAASTWIRGYKNHREENHDPKLKFYAADFHGVLQVTNVEKMLSTIRQGIGTAKGFGFGLLTVGKVPGQ
ncbi:MAG: type I-E CRISPR-associated protein Cas6/Cse3/CasE [Phycisphaerae bacterium]|nr:type I-E CRISPR-associated protein Cas6/Cse3/CasE [Phycisphaerae bacterium]